MSEISFSSDIESIGWDYSYLYHNSNLSNECEADFLDTSQESYYEDAEYHFDDQVLMIIKKAVLFQKNRFKMLTENQLHLMLYRWEGAAEWEILLHTLEIMFHLLKNLKRIILENKRELWLKIPTWNLWLKEGRPLEPKGVGQEEVLASQEKQVLMIQLVHHK